MDSFEVGRDYILVKFKSGREQYYLYTYSATGVAAVESMKKLAVNGKGLGGMLASKPYYTYAKKW